MSYASAEDFVAHFGVRESTMVSDRANSGEPDLTELLRLCELASQEVDGYIGRRYALPLTQAVDGRAATTPAPLRLAALTLARYHATGTEVLSTDEIRERYKATVRWLEGVAEGKIQLGAGLLPAASGGIASTGGATAMRAGHRVFGTDVLRRVF